MTSTQIPEEPKLTGDTEVKPENDNYWNRVRRAKNNLSSTREKGLKIRAD